MAQLETIQLVLLTLSAAYEHPLSESTLAVYATALSDVPDEALQQAAATHISRTRFFPRISELRALALSGQFPDPLAAWGEVLRQVRQVGFYGQPAFSSPLIARAVDALGWLPLCHSDNLPSERARFIQAYETLVRRETEKRVAFPVWDSWQLPSGAHSVQALCQGLGEQLPPGGKTPAHLPSAGR